MPTPPAFISSVPTNGLTTQTTTTAGSITLPATLPWDILILIAVNGGGTGALTTGGTYTGGAWTSVQAAASTGAWGGTWWSRCTADHTGETVTTGTATDSTALAAMVIRGCRTGSSPINGTPAVAQHAVSGVPTPANFTAQIDDLIVYTLMADDNIGWSALACNVGSPTERIEVGSSGGADSLVGAATMTAPTTGAVGTWSGTHTPTLGKIGIAFALAPDDFLLRPPMMGPPR